MKISELTGAALDWAVAKCEGHDVFIKHAPVQVMYTPKGKRSGYIYTPSTNWSQGGPIIEREGITVSDGSPVTGLEWMACDRGSTHIQHGPTYLIAAMRCYVTSKLGGDADIPEELL
jgi:hypothetical protein